MKYFDTMVSTMVLSLMHGVHENAGQLLLIGVMYE